MSQNSIYKKAEYKISSLICQILYCNARNMKCLAMIIYARGYLEKSNYLDRRFSMVSFLIPVLINMWSIKSNNSLIVQVFKPFMFQGDGPTIKVYFILFLASSANFQVSMIKILNYRDPMICGHKKYNLVSR